MTLSQPQADNPSDQRRQAMLSAIQRIQAAQNAVLKTEEAARSRFEKQGKLLPRERLALLLDPGTSFHELMALAGYRMHDDKDGSGAGGGFICGLGFVSGVRCMIMVSNSAVKGGAIPPAGLQKALRCQEIALQNKCPVLFLVESAGANLMYQSEVFIDGGRGFANQARLSAASIPQITVVHGSSTAGGAYFPGMSDYVIMVKGKAKVFLAGPPLLKAATGEIATEEELGGAEMHAQIAGTAEYLAQDDRDAVRLAREITATLSWSPQLPVMEDVKPPQKPIDDILSLVPVDFKQHYDVRELLTCLLDNSHFLEFKAQFEQFTICGHAKIGGFQVGLIGNNGPITHKGATKAAQFIQLCCQSGTPIVYLQNTTGFMVGRDAEQAGIVKHGSKMLQAVANASVPQITLQIGASFGAGNYGMCGRGMGPRFIFSWPNTRIGVMGGKQAAGVMSMITAAKMKRKGVEPDPQQMAQMEAQIQARMDAESDILFGSARLWDDGIIDPRQTREVLIFTLATCLEADSRQLRPTTHGVARL